MHLLKKISNWFRTKIMEGKYFENANLPSERILVGTFQEVIKGTLTLKFIDGLISFSLSI